MIDPVVALLLVVPVAVGGAGAARRVAKDQRWSTLHKLGVCALIMLVPALYTVLVVGLMVVGK